ncbi:MAG TPA: hypothetical protein DDZ29_14405, partial [Alteromonas mediterranea]|nr:hypothetical protein [Alteromonas mediterranea]
KAGIGSGAGAGEVGGVGAGCCMFEKSLSLSPQALRSAVRESAISVRLLVNVVLLIIACFP